LWRGLTPLTRWLVGICITLSLFLPVLMTAAGGRTALHHLRHILIWNILGDSWQPVKAAISYLSVFPDHPLYTSLFLDSHIRFQYPPASLLFIEPFYALPQVTSDPDFWLNLVSVIVFLVNIALVVVILFRVLADKAPSWLPRERRERTILGAAIAVLALTFTPLVSSPDWGQTQTWISAAFAGAVLAWLADRKALAGVLIGFTVAFKPQLGLLLVWGLLRREWRFAGAAFVTMLVIGVASLAVFGFAQHFDYLKIVSYLSRHGESYWWNQSVMGLLHRLQFNGANTEEEAAAALLDDSEFLPPFDMVSYAGGLLTSALMILAALFWRAREHRRAPLIDFMLAALTFTVASPIAWGYHYGIAVPIFAVALPLTLAAPEMGRLRLVWLGLAFVLLHNRFDVTLKLAHTPLNFLESTFLFGALLLMWHLYRLRHVYGGEATSGVAAPRVAAR
jgi:hypothetical protein